MITEWLIYPTAIAAGLLCGVIGFGTSILLMPFLVQLYGPIKTIPIIALIAIVANSARVLLWWRLVDRRSVFYFSVSAVPSVVVGANTLVRLTPQLVEICLGVFLIAMIPIRRWLAKQAKRLNPPHMVLVGAVIGYLSGIVATTGPLNTPFFLALGLSKGAYLGTEAAASLVMFAAKGLRFHQLDVIDMQAVSQGLIIGAFVFAGSTLSKRMVLALSERTFMRLMEAVMLISGLSMLWMAVA